MDIKKNLENAVDSIKDVFSEAGHQSTADAERTRREVAGDAMTPGETLGSVANETKNSVQANMDHAKVEARKEL